MPVRTNATGDARSRAESRVSSSVRQQHGQIVGGGEENQLKPMNASKIFPGRIKKGNPKLTAHVPTERPVLVQLYGISI